MEKTRVLLFGLGSIGRRHARLIQQHFPHHLAAFRTMRGQEPNDLGIPELDSWEEVARGGFDVALIANPTFLHVETALRCAALGLHLFIEKPVDCTLERLDELLGMVGERSLSAYVAYPLRFHPVVRALAQRLEDRRVLHAGMVCASFLPDWRPNRDLRTVYSSFRDQGGGVLLEMSHELDMAQFLFGPVLEIRGALTRQSELTADADDCADLVLVHEWGTCNIHLDMFSGHARRFVEVETDEGYLRGDVRESIVTEIVGGECRTEALPTDRDFMYLEQLRYFFANLGHPDMQNNLLQASDLYRRMIGFREEQGYGTVDHDMRQGRLAGSQG